MRKVLGFLLLVGAVAWADTLVLSDGTLLSGRVQGLTATSLGFVTAEGLRWIPLEAVQRVSLEFAVDSEPRVEKRLWAKILGLTQRELWNCQHFREGLVLAGLLFIGAGQWLVSLGYSPFGGLLTALGSLSVLYGLSAPRAHCQVPAARLRTLLYLGLEHGWLF